MRCSNALPEVRVPLHIRKQRRHNELKQSGKIDARHGVLMVYRKVYLTDSLVAENSLRCWPDEPLTLCLRADALAQHRQKSCGHCEILSQRMAHALAIQSTGQWR